MGEMLIDESMTFHTILQQKFDKNIDRLQQIKKFSLNCSKLFGGFSKSVSQSCRQLFLSLKDDQEQDRNIIFLSKYIIDIMNELSKKFDMISKKLHNEIVDPLNEFIQNHSMTNKIVLRQSQQNIYQLESNNQFLKELSKNFDINSKVQKMQKQQKMAFRKIYQLQMQKCNQKWSTIKQNYQQILLKIDLYNSSRCHFTTKLQLTTIKLINKLVNDQNIQESLEDYQDLSCQTNQLTVKIKDQLRQKIKGKLNLLQDKNMMEIQQFQFPSMHQKQSKIIDDFVCIFTSKSNIKQQSKDFQQARGLILDKIEWIKYFLCKMQSSLHTQLHLPIVKYRQLLALIKYIFAYCAQQSQPQCQSLLYSILYISYRIKYNQQYLIKDIGKQQDYWKDYRIWFRLIQYIKRTKYSYKGVPKDLRSYFVQGGKVFAKDFWNRARNRKIQYQKVKSERVILDARDYDVISQVNYFMIRLEIQDKFAFNFILEARDRYNLTQDNVTKLIKSHYFNRLSYNNKIGSTQLRRKKRLQRKYSNLNGKQQTLCLFIGKSLQFLDIKTDNIVSLRLVNKYWSQKLSKRIYQRYLIYQNVLSSKNRLKIYKSICRPPYTIKLYERMVKQMPQSSQHTQIIYLDARRSLCWDQTLRIALMQVLGVFAFYHPQVGYLQGMNYLCQNIIKLSSCTFQVYSIFQHLMNSHYSNMYTGKFQGLKIKIYQMMRVLQRQNPQLYNHFQAEKIQGQHFLLSWAITLWGEMSGELNWILWDGFLVKGWKWWFKTCLWLLTKLEPQLLKMNFQEMMRCFSSLGTQVFSLTLTDLDCFAIDKTKIKQEINKIDIQSDILKDIQKQYLMKMNTMNDVLKKIPNKNAK